MSIELTMPALSPTMETGRLSKWLVREGDMIEAGDVVAEIETDKATMEVEAVDEGVLEKIIIPEGTDDVPINTVIALITGEGTATAGEKVVEDSSVNHKAQDHMKQIKLPEVTMTPPPIPVSVKQQPDVMKPNGVSADHTNLTYDGATVSLSVREALRDAMVEEMNKDENVFVMGEEVGEYQGAYKVTQGLLDKFGKKRVIDTPITEYGFAGIGCGAALAGLKPVVEFMTFNFAMQAIDHIINTAAKTLYMSGGQMKCPIVFRGPNGAASRVAAQHSQDYSAWYASVPGLIVIAPYSAADAKGLLKSAIRNPNPVVFLENELLYGQTFEVPVDKDFLVPIGKANILKEGTDVTIISYSRGLTYCLETVEELTQQNISCELIDLRTLRPIDFETITQSIKKTNRLVIVEEGWPVCSIGDHIITEVCSRSFDDLDAPPLKVSGKDVPMPYAENLEKLALPSVDEIIHAVHQVCYSDKISEEA